MQSAQQAAGQLPEELAGSAAGLRVQCQSVLLLHDACSRSTGQHCLPPQVEYASDRFNKTA